MAKTALTQLQEQIEAVRRESFAAGYAAAMQELREFAARPAPSSPAAAAPRRGRRAAAVASPNPPASAPGRRRRGAPATPRRAHAGGRRVQRGTNARLVEEVLQSMAPAPVRPAQIKSALQAKGVSMAFTSIRHALTQLEARHSAEQIAEEKTWRYLGDGNAATSA